MPTDPILREIDAIMIRVPDLDRGLAFYRDALGHEVLWRNDELGQVGLRLPDAETEIVITDRLDTHPAWRVADAAAAAEGLVAAGARMVMEPSDIPVGRVAVVEDPFGNRLTLVDLTKGRY